LRTLARRPLALGVQSAPLRVRRCRSIRNFLNCQPRRGSGEKLTALAQLAQLAQLARLARLAQLAIDR
jgi:hypothetical protein